MVDIVLSFILTIIKLFFNEETLIKWTTSFHNLRKKYFGFDEFEVQGFKK